MLVGVKVYRTRRGRRLELGRVGSIAQFVLILLVASIPVALPAVMSVTMAIGAYALSRQKAILSRLSAIEELAGVDVLCSDKTGTLTLNQLTVDAASRSDRAKADDVLRGAALATQTSSEDPIDLAVLHALKDAPSCRGQSRRLSCRSIRSTSARSQPSSMQGGQIRHYAKGAPQVIAAWPSPMRQRSPATTRRSPISPRGYRALASPNPTDGKTWQLVGLISLKDPPRPDAKATIAETEALGLNVKMVTGDDVAIGDQIAKQLGMGDHLLVASDVFKDGHGNRQLRAVRSWTRSSAPTASAACFPQHKYEIVKALQQRGHIVAMTGDGVNDAPALRQADCGIAVSGATDAARSAAALILTAPGLSTIVNAIAAPGRSSSASRATSTTASR